MNLYFVGYYKPYDDICIGIFELKTENNLHVLKYRWGFQKGRYHFILDKIDRPFYFVNNFLGCIYKGGFPFKPEYFDCVMDKEELSELLLR